MKQPFFYFRTLTGKNIRLKLGKKFRFIKLDFFSQVGYELDFEKLNFLVQMNRPIMIERFSSRIKISCRCINKCVLNIETIPRSTAAIPK